MKKKDFEKNVQNGLFSEWQHFCCRACPKEYNNGNLGQFFFLSSFTNIYFRGDTEISIDEQNLKSFPSILVSSFMHCFFDLLPNNGYILVDIQL